MTASLPGGCRAVRVPLVLLLAGLLLCGGATAGLSVGAGPATGTAATGTVAPDVATATDTQTVIVYFDTPATRDTIARQGAVTVETLSTRAETTQEPLRRYANATAGVTLDHQFWLGNLAAVTIDHRQVDVLELAAVAAVSHIGPNIQLEAVTSGATDTTTPSASPPDTSGPDATHTQPTATETTYGLEQINAPAAWDQYDTRGAGATVAVLDTGVDTAHPDLNVTRWAEWDKEGTKLDTEPSDGHGHGTHVSGTVAGGNASGIHVGVAPESELYHGKVFADDGTATAVQVLAGMQWAVENDADVLSLSLGAEGYSDVFITPVRDANAAGTMVTAAAGNTGDGSSVSPGNVYDAVSVGASDSERDIAWFSSGEVVTRDEWAAPPADWPDAYRVPTVTAPGVSVYSTYLNGEYRNLQGTSMATPHVAGAVALVHAATDAELSPDTIRGALIETAVTPDGVDPTQDTRYGHGIIDVRAAIDLLVDNDPAFVTVDITGTNSPVTAGETANVTAELTNLGDEAVAQTITLAIDGGVGEVAVAEHVTLAGGATETITLSWVTAPDAAGEYTATVATDNETATVPLTVHEPPVGAAVSLSNQTQPYVTGYTDVVVDTASADQVFVIVVSNDTGASIGTSDPFAAGTTAESVAIALPPDVTRRQPVTATLHEAAADDAYGPPIEADNTVVADTAFLTITGPTIRTAPAQDLNGDGRFEDIEGTGELTIFDVQRLFSEQRNEAMTTNPRLFTFDGQTPDRVTVFDIQALFRQLQTNEQQHRTVHTVAALWAVPAGDDSAQNVHASVRRAATQRDTSIFLRGENPAVHGGSESDKSCINHVLRLIRIFN